MTRLDPKNHVVFNKIFGENKKFVISLLNDLLQRNNDGKIKEIEYLSPNEYLSSELVSDLFSCAPINVKCTDQNELIFIVEMQILWTDVFIHRVSFNDNKAFLKHQKKIGLYMESCPIYSLNLLDAVYVSDESKYYHHYSIVEDSNTCQVIKGLELVFIELPKFLQHSDLMNDRLRNMWLKFLTLTETSEIQKDLLNDLLIQEALEFTKANLYTSQELAVYEKSWDTVSYGRTLLSDATARARRHFT